MDSSNCQGIDKFIEGLNEIDIHLNDIQIRQFIDYFELLTEWNKVMNLTTITDFDEVITKHFIDSLALVKILRPVGQKILDLGTGAGFPGIPIKIAFPETKITLLDSLNKRINFLDEVIKKLDLKYINTIHGRAEDYAKKSLYRECFDLCVSRAVAKLTVLSEYCIPYVKPEGYFIAYKSGNTENEISDSKKAIKLLGAKIEKTEEFIIPGTDFRRTLIMIHKVTATPLKYPRSAGKPMKEPL